MEPTPTNKVRVHYEVLSRFTKLLPASTGERNTRSAKRNRSKTYEYVINNSFSAISSLPILASTIRFAAFESAEETIQPYANCSTSPSHLTPTQHRRRHLPHPSSCQHFPSSGNDRQPCASIVIYFVSVLGGRKAHLVDPPFKATEILMFHNFWVGPCCCTFVPCTRRSTSPIRIEKGCGLVLLIK